MALTPEEIADGAACYCIPNDLSALLYLLDQIRVNGGGSVMTPNEISEAAACYCIPDEKKAILYLLNAILTNGGGGGGGGGLSGAVDPEGAVTASPGTTYYNTANQSFWVKATGVGNTGWIPLIV